MVSPVQEDKEVCKYPEKLPVDEITAGPSICASLKELACKKIKSKIKDLCNSLLDNMVDIFKI